MDRSQSEHEEALRVWRESLTASNPLIRGLNAMLWDKIKHNEANGIWVSAYDRTPEEQLQPMSLVIGTVGNIDPNSLCEDASCDQHGEAMKDHQVTHKNKAGPRGARGVCKHCQGRMHNSNDAEQLIAFQCLWKQAFGEDARKTKVNQDSLDAVVHCIRTGVIAGWADRALTHTAVLSRPVAVPLAPVVSSSPSPVVAGPASTSSHAPIAPVSPTAPARTPALVGEIKPPPPMTEAALAKRRAQIKAALKGAKVEP